MKYVYIYSNNSKCGIDFINDLDLQNQYVDIKYHSKIINNKNMIKECSGQKFVHILEKYKSSFGYNNYKYMTTYSL